MCMVSVIGDVYAKKWEHNPFNTYGPGTVISRAEFDELKVEVMALRKLLQAAKKFDVATNQPDCETGDKMKVLRNVAEALGVDLDEVLKKE